MDMAIVNAAEAIPVDDIPTELREAIDDLLLCRRDDATERLVDIAGKMLEAQSAQSSVSSTAPTDGTTQTPVSRLQSMVERGVSDGIEAVLADALAELGKASAVIDGPLMQGMDRVGTLFGEGRMFLPQVVKSAHAMKRAVEWLTPQIEREVAESVAEGADSVAQRPSMVLATVKGDVHDIGKNIVATVLRCNGLEIIDLGVMVPAHDIVERAIAEKASFVGLSGLITPSLEEMCRVARLMEERGLTIPLLVGGATTSLLHTAVKIAPCYSGAVIHTRDAAMLPSVVKTLLNPELREAYLRNHAAEQAKLREEYAAEQLRRRAATGAALTPAELLQLRPKYDYQVAVPLHIGAHDIKISVADARRLINWRAFMTAWGLDASLGTVAEIQGCDHCRTQWLAAIPQKLVGKAAEAMQLVKEANRVLDYLESTLLVDGLSARVVLLPAGSRGDDIVVVAEDGAVHTFPTLRRAPQSSGDTSLALSDFVKPLGADGRAEDYIGLFAVTVGEAVDRRAVVLRNDGDDYRSLLYRTVADRLAEAATEWLHYRVRTELWGYAPEESAPKGALLDNSYRGIRPAFGYPCLPDQSLIFVADELLKYGEIGITLTENGAMSPAASTSGLMIAHPDSRYFVIDTLNDAVRADYAARRGLSPADLSRFLPK
jgi:5-methyltetrahydrofolate--homocysteine methyltransferase